MHASQSGGRWAYTMKPSPDDKEGVRSMNANPGRHGQGLWVLRHLPLAVVVVMILYGAIVPLPVPHVVVEQDKVQHALAFLAFAVTLRFARPRVALRWVMLWVVLFGVGIEVMQAFVPGRDVSFWDVVADTLGGVLGCLVPARMWTWLERWIS